MDNIFCKLCEYFDEETSECIFQGRNIKVDPHIDICGDFEFHGYGEDFVK